MRGLAHYLPQKPATLQIKNLGTAKLDPEHFGDPQNLWPSDQATLQLRLPDFEKKICALPVLHGPRQTLRHPQAGEAALAIWAERSTRRSFVPLVLSRTLFLDQKGVFD